MKISSSIIAFFLLFFVMVMDICGNADYKNSGRKKKTAIVLKKFEVSNLPKKIGKQVHNRLRTELGKSDNVRIISGKNSSNDQKVINGMAGKIGSAYIISLKITDKQTGRTRRATGDCNGSLEKFLNKTIPEVAKKILR